VKGQVVVVRFCPCEFPHWMQYIHDLVYRLHIASDWSIIKKLNYDIEFIINSAYEVHISITPLKLSIAQAGVSGSEGCCTLLLSLMYGLNQTDSKMFMLF
jgi:hypothetical protein